MPYSGDPSTSPRDAVRFWLQDTSQSSPLLSDVELTYFLDLASDYTDNPILLAASLCPVIQAKYAGAAQIAGDGITYSEAQLQDKYEQLAVSLRAQYARLTGSAGVPFAGGLDRCREPAWDTMPPLFAIGMDDNPRGSSQLTDGPVVDPYYDPDNLQV